MHERDPNVGLTLRELVLEVRDSVNALDEKIDRIDRQGSIGTREDLSDHEQRIRRVEAWVYGIPFAGVLAAGSVVAALVGRF